jgi:hypothetical protein
VSGLNGDNLTKKPTGDHPLLQWYADGPTLIDIIGMCEVFKGGRYIYLVGSCSLIIDSKFRCISKSGARRRSTITLCDIGRIQRHVCWRYRIGKNRSRIGADGRSTSNYAKWRFSSSQM